MITVNALTSIKRFGGDGETYNLADANYSKYLPRFDDSTRLLNERIRNNLGGLNEKENKIPTCCIIPLDSN